ncbi:histidine phosphatase family protein [Mycolicibacterium sp. XJ1819]
MRADELSSATFQVLMHRNNAKVTAAAGDPSEASWDRHNAAVGVIYLLRHGQAPVESYGSMPGSSLPGHGLTPLGREQARLAAAALARRVDSFDWAVSGEIDRQRETLHIVMERFGGDFSENTDPQWNEYDLDAVLGGGGVAATTGGRELQRLVDDRLSRWTECAGVDDDFRTETYAQYRQRCTAALMTVQRHAVSGRSVLVVSSAGTISHVTANLLGMDARSWIQLSRTMLNASITKLIVGRTGTSVMSINDHAHLDTGHRAEKRGLMTFR